MRDDWSALLFSRLSPVLVLQSASSRTPLRWSPMDPPMLNSLAPKFEESYKMKKDGDKVRFLPNTRNRLMIVNEYHVVSWSPRSFAMEIHVRVYF